MRITGIGVRHVLVLGLIAIAVGCGRADRSSERMSARPPIETSQPPESEEVTSSDLDPLASDVEETAPYREAFPDTVGTPPPPGDPPELSLAPPWPSSDSLDAAPPVPRSIGSAAPRTWSQAAPQFAPRSWTYSGTAAFPPPRAEGPGSASAAVVLGTPGPESNTNFLSSSGPPAAPDSPPFESLSLGAAMPPETMASTDEPVSTDIAYVDAIRAKLHEGNIVYNAPDTMQYGETRDIELLLSPNQSAAELVPQLRDPRNVASSGAQTGNRMEAILTGTGFRIESLSAPLQAVTSAKATRWRWRVMPTKYGPQELQLQLMAHIDIAGNDAPLEIETKNAVIQVHITVGQQVAGFVESNWQWLWAAVVLPVFGFRRRRQKRQDDEEPRRAAA